MVRRPRKKCRKNCRKVASIYGLFFDGKKNNTLQRDYTLEKEERVVVINEPGSSYVTHVIPNGGKAELVFNAFVEGLADVDLSGIVAIGADGTNSNTGRHGGIITRLKRYHGHKYYWMVRSK